MAALDTNVLIRFLIRDDAAQADLANQLFRAAVVAGETLFVPVTVLLEVEWVLRSRYGFAKTAVQNVLAALLSTFELRFESENAVEIALAHFDSSKADFSDCLHAALAHSANETPLWTFDKAAAKVDGARLLMA